MICFLPSPQSEVQDAEFEEVFEELSVWIKEYNKTIELKGLLFDFTV